MAYVNYMEVGKEVFIVGLAEAAAGYIHIMFISPQFVGQTIAGINTLLIIDVILAFVVGIATKMYARDTVMQVAGYGMAGFLFAMGLLQQLGVFGTVPAVRARMPLAARPTAAAIPRAGYLAPAGVVVNKHGSVPEIAIGTFG